MVIKLSCMQPLQATCRLESFRFFEDTQIQRLCPHNVQHKVCSSVPKIWTCWVPHIASRKRFVRVELCLFLHFEIFCIYSTNCCLGVLLDLTKRPQKHSCQSKMKITIIHVCRLFFRVSIEYLIKQVKMIS